jgi:uncharacterized membrane protein
MAQTTTRRRGSEASRSSPKRSAAEKKSEVLDGSKEVARGDGRKRASERTSGNTRARANGSGPSRANARPPAGKSAKAAKAARSDKAGAASKARPASKAAEALAEHAPSLPKPHSLGGKLALAAIKKIAKRAARTAGGAIRELTTQAVTAARDHVQSPEGATTGRLPIQVSIDIAVPIRVAWEEWMALDALPEGIDTVTDIERDGQDLIGRTSDPRQADWAAEVLDERERESFAWQSHEGSDCAGLVTFHELSDRLTRIELNLDVVPTTLAEHIALTTHVANRKARTDLRRLKARLELINPDAYPPPDDEPDQPDDPDPDQDPDYDHDPDPDQDDAPSNGSDPDA